MNEGRGNLRKVLVDRTSEAEHGVDRILEAAFFRTRPLQLGACPVIRLADHRRPRDPNEPKT